MGSRRVRTEPTENGEAAGRARLQAVTWEHEVRARKPQWDRLDGRPAGRPISRTVWSVWHGGAVPVRTGVQPSRGRTRSLQLHGLGFPLLARGSGLKDCAAVLVPVLVLSWIHVRFGALFLSDLIFSAFKTLIMLLIDWCDPWWSWGWYSMETFCL